MQTSSGPEAVLAGSVGIATNEVSGLCQPGDWAMLMTGAVGSAGCRTCKLLLYLSSSRLFDLAHSWLLR